MKNSFELKYLFLLSSQLPGFKKTGNNVFNFRCPSCGDSHRKKSKKRGYIYEKNGKLVFYCHNCLSSKPFKYLLKDLNETLYQEYIQETFKPKNDYLKFEEQPKIVIRTNAIDRLEKISRLSPDHPCKKFVIDRQIPTTYHSKLFFTSKFKSFVNSIIPNKFEKIEIDESRLIIPIYFSGILVGFQGRSLEPSDVKYITIVLDETKKPLLYGYDDIEWNVRHYVLEGPIDSMFISNSIAVLGSSLLKGISLLKKPKNYSTLIFDNEPRNSQIIDQMKKAVKEGFRICIFPDSIKEKDINDMILSMVGKADHVQTEKVIDAGKQLKLIIDQNTFFGLTAELKISEWGRT